MTLCLGDIAPDFKAETTEGSVSFHDWIGSGWAILFSHPKDYTPVCTTEMGAAAKLAPAFKKLNVKLIGLSFDSVEDHKGWNRDIEKSQSCAISFPVISDRSHEVAKLYGMIHPKMDGAHAVRSLFVIGPDRKIKLMMTYPMATGRSFDEVLRVIESLQRTAEHKVATPANWQPGQEVLIIPSVSDAEARKLFPEGYRSVNSYLRYAKDPVGGSKKSSGSGKKPKAA